MSRYQELLEKIAELEEAATTPNDKPSKYEVVSYWIYQHKSIVEINGTEQDAIDAVFSNSTLPAIISPPIIENDGPMPENMSEKQLSHYQPTVKKL
jgi:hypothetical protein